MSSERVAATAPCTNAPLATLQEFHELACRVLGLQRMRQLRAGGTAVLAELGDIKRQLAAQKAYDMDAPCLKAARIPVV